MFTLLSASALPHVGNNESSSVEITSLSHSVTKLNVRTILVREGLLKCHCLKLMQSYNMQS